MANHFDMQLGKLPPRHDARTLFLSPYLSYTTPDPPPAKAYYEYLVKQWGEMGNNEIGDCTCAAAGHMIMNWTAHSAKEVIPTDEQIVEAYTAVSGYNPTNGLNDVGAVELDVLKHWRKNGIAGHKIEAFAAVDPKNLKQVKQALYLFGGIYVGAMLPQSAGSQEVWDVVEGSNEWGGHAFPVLGYGRDGFACITWGQIKYMTTKFWLEYVEECWAVLSLDWVNANEQASNGVALSNLRADVQIVAG